MQAKLGEKFGTPTSGDSGNTPVKKNEPSKPAQDNPKKKDNKPVK